MSLTSASLSLVAEGAAGDGSNWTLPNARFTISTATGSTLVFYAEPTDEDTDDLVEGGWPFQVEATLSSGRIVTLVSGILSVTKDIA